MEKITKPTFLVNLDVCRKNIESMAKKAERHGLAFRPHFKTHQSNIVASLYKEFGVYNITVSSLEMAEQFAKHGWNDITVAFPVNILEIETINTLAKSIKLNLLVESPEVVNYLNQHLKYKLNVFIKIDTGYKRTGVSDTNIAEILPIMDALNASWKMNFAGFLSHSGNTYQAQTTEEITIIHTHTLKSMATLKTKFPNALISIGDTPSCSIMDNFKGVDEIRPGNFVYYDATQMYIGSCQVSQVAGVMACPIVAKHPERNEIIIYGGAVHFSKEYLSDAELGMHYGQVIAKNTHDNWEIIPQAFLKKLSQEHGTVQAGHEFVSRVTIGDLLYFLPVHSCLTANLMKNNTVFL